MKEIIEVIENKYNIDDICHMDSENMQLLEFNINSNNIRIYKVDNGYYLTLSIINSNINMNLFINTMIDFLIKYEEE